MANLRRRGMSFPFLDESKDSETKGNQCEDYPQRLWLKSLVWEVCADWLNSLFAAANKLAWCNVRQGDLS